MQIELLSTILILIAIGLVAFGCIVRLFIESPKEMPPAEWRPTISTPFRPSDERMEQVPEFCPLCNSDLSPYGVEWDPVSGEAYCPVCKFPLKAR